MTRANYHTHTKFCDGRNTASEMISAAAAGGFRYLGFSGHGPIPLETEWNMKQSDLAAYIDSVRSAPDCGLQVLCGIEADYISKVASPHDFAGAGLDYIIGSVHFLPFQDSFRAIDGPVETFREILGQTYGNSIESMVRAYFSAVCEMISFGGFSILGHMDLVRKRNDGNVFFSEDEPWYRSAVRDTLDLVAETGIVMETNTGAIARGACSTPYPSLWIMREALKRDIPIVMNADAHEPSHLSAELHEHALRALREAGYREHYLLRHDGWHSEVL